MADYQSIQMLAFNFASRTFAYRPLAQGVNCSLSAFSSFKRRYLDNAIKADQYDQHVDDIGIAANDSTQLCFDIKTIFECIKKAGLKLTMAKCHFGVEQVDFLGRSIIPEGVSPQPRKSNKFSRNSNSRNPKKPFNGTLGFLTTKGTIFLICQKSFCLSSNCSMKYHSSAYQTRSWIRSTY